MGVFSKYLLYILFFATFILSYPVRGGLFCCSMWRLSIYDTREVGVWWEGIPITFGRWGGLNFKAKSPGGVGVKFFRRC